MPNWVQNEIIFENASDEDVAIDNYSDPEITEIGELETVDSGLSISDLI